MKKLSKLFSNNKDWVSSVCDKDPNFFKLLSQKQSPEYLWIGCCDSRVPPETITGLLPGDLFVHRNVANQVLPNDMNVNAILKLALNSLNIRHIVIAGHYQCFGVETALTPATGDLEVDKWLASLRETCNHHRTELDQCMTSTEKTNRLSEINVLKQVEHLVHHELVKAIWNQGETLIIHGIMYDVKTGLLKDLGLHVGQASELPALL